MQKHIQKLSCELMNHLRGEHSQRKFSQLLGFSSNVAYMWETGRRYPEASVFFKAAHKREPQFGTRFLALLRLATPALGRATLRTPRGVNRLVEYLCQGANRSELARRVGVDRTTLSRWITGQTEPRLPELLLLVETTTQQLLMVVALLSDPALFPSIRDTYRDQQLQRRLAYDLPWSHAVLRALELDAYSALPAHVDGFLASTIGIGLEEERGYLEQLAQAGQIRWSGSHWVSHRVMTVDTRQDPDKNRALKVHWGQVTVDRLRTEQAPADALFSFNLFSISAAAYEQLREMHLAHYDRVRALIEGSPGTDKVVLMNLHLVPLKPPSRSTITVSQNASPHGRKAPHSDAE
jgi:transcriptional regulator with XRE-family HTH domain